MTWLRIPAFLGALLAAPLLIAAEAPTPKDRASPTSSPGSWFSDADYPLDAQRAEIDGTTAFRLDIDRLGVPTRCTITTSSGSASLDTATCDKLMVRARFTPAKDAKGKSVPDTYNGRITWRLPDNDGTRRLPPMPFHSVTTFIINPDGSASDCTTTMNGKPMDAGGPCQGIVSSRYTVQKDGAGKPVRQKIRMTTSFEKVAE